MNILFKRKLFPNVDFYSGIILKAMGFPEEMFTVLFAVWSYRWLGITMERNDGRTVITYWSPTSIIHWPCQT